MATSQLTKVMDYLRRAVLAGADVDLTDGQLLECFLNHHDEAAVAALVRRHGPMVWGVCRRVLRSHHDAEDAFQATFLVLIRKAASITPKEAVANWLHGVAHQTARKARATMGKRQGREKQVHEMPEPKAGTESELGRDLQDLLDQELSRLPDKYRLAIVLCDLEGRSRKRAADQLQIPEGTLSSRLTTARTMLAKRLARHGLTAAGGTLAAVLSQKAALASVPAGVVSSTIKAVTSVAAGNSAATGLISAKVTALTEGVIKAMLLTKLKTMTALLLLLSMVTLTSVMVPAWVPTGDKGNGVDKPAAKAGNKLKDAEGDVEKPAAKAEKQPAKAQPKDQPKEFTNSIGMKFVWIPPGSFMMGSPKEEKGRSDGEIQHKVTLTRGFYMGIHLVTQEQWKEVMGNNPSRFKGEKNLPVETVSWDDCQEFIKKLREKDKKPYRLPSEAEWEYACRAGTTTPFHFGETISTDQANYLGEAVHGNGKKDVYRGKTTPVGSFPANAWGLFDMHGNIYEWCQDWFLDYYSNTEVVDPQGPVNGEGHVVRGGSWISSLLQCRSAHRSFRNVIRPPKEPPGLGSTDGLRVCFNLEPAVQQGNPNNAKPVPPPIAPLPPPDPRLVPPVPPPTVFPLTGRTGFPLGTSITIEGAWEVNKDLPSKIEAMKVDVGNGKKLEQPLFLNVCNVVAPKRGQRYVFQGYEGQKWIGGNPDEQAARQLHVYFVVTSVVSPKDVKLSPDPYALPLPPTTPPPQSLPPDTPPPPPPPTGLFGHPPGTIVTIEGVMEVNKYFNLRNMKIDVVNGKKLEQPLFLDTCNFGLTSGAQRYVLKGYESQEWIGENPDGQGAKQLHPVFVLTSIVSPKDVKPIRDPSPLPSPPPTPPPTPQPPQAAPNAEQPKASQQKAEEPAVPWTEMSQQGHHIVGMKKEIAIDADTALKIFVKEPPRLSKDWEKHVPGKIENAADAADADSIPEGAIKIGLPGTGESQAGLLRYSENELVVVIEQHKWNYLWHNYYECKARLRLPRSQEVDALFGLADIEKAHKTVFKGIKRGDSEEAVIKALGNPDRAITYQPAGYFQFVYAKENVIIHFDEFRVATIVFTVPQAPQPPPSPSPEPPPPPPSVPPPNGKTGPASPVQPKDPPKNFTNSLGMKFVWIPPGTFLMGSPKEEPERRDDEIQHKVTLTKGFYMGIYAVTQEQWVEIMDNNPSKFKGEKNLPVEQVSWDDCQEFIKKLREKDKKKYRLPTEAEWEYACRAGTTTPFHFGATISSDQANYLGSWDYPT